MVSADLPRPEAPRVIAVVRDFVNTTDHETQTDELVTPAALARYLHAEGLLPASARATSADLRLAVELRRGLRSALELNHVAGAASLPVLEQALARLPVQLGWSGSEVSLVPGATGVRGSLASIGLAAHQAVADGSWWRLKICASDECEWAYFDHSKNRSRNWCEYGCGNKIKTRAYRARRAEQAR